MANVYESDFEPRRHENEWRDKVVLFLQAGVCEFRFQKQDGTIRDMKATLQENVIPEIKNERKSNPDNLVVYDVEAQGWRTVKFDKIMHFKVITE
jgi:hypothetical protein